MDFGGRVMKNVAGYDLSRLMVGAFGTLGLLLEISLKVLPRPEREITLVRESTAQEALASFNQWAALPLPISASCFDGQRLFLRLSGAESAVEAARRRLGGEPLVEGDTLHAGGVTYSDFEVKIKGKGLSDDLSDYIVEATDNAFNTGQDESDGTFSIESPPGGIVPTTLRDFDQPGSQPFEAGILNPPEACSVCHGDYDPAVEPYYNWQGSMMGNAMRDPLFAGAAFRSPGGASRQGGSRIPRDGCAPAHVVGPVDSKLRHVEPS